MRRADRWLAGGAAAAILLGTRHWLLGFLDQEPLARYGFQWLVKIPPGENWFYGAYLLAGTAATALGAWAIHPFLRPALARSLPGNPGRGGVWLLALASLAVGLTAWVGLGLLQDTVVTDDEDVYVFQARLLLEGRASAPAPPLPEFFANAFVDTRNGRWFGQYPPGHPLALAPAVWIGIPRLTPIALAGANVVLTGLVVRTCLGSGWGIAGALALLLSPLFLLTGSTLLSHPTAYFGLVLAAWGAARTARSGTGASGLLVGAGLGIAFLARPWTGLILGSFPALWFLWALRRHGALRPGILAASVLAAAVAMFLLYNRGQSGDLLVTGYEAQRRSGGMIEFGFGPILPGIHTHSPAQGVVNALRHGWRFLAWSWPWALLALWALPAARNAPRRETRDAPLPLSMLTAGAGLMILAGCASYIPYWSIGVGDTGPVKTYELLLPLALLTALGARRWAARRGPAGPAAWALASLVTAGVLFWPVQIGHLAQVSARVRAPLEAIAAVADPPALVFLPNPAPAEAGSWVFGRPNPRPDLSDPVLFVRDLGPANATLARLFPVRTPYVANRIRGTVELRRLEVEAGAQ